jgi:hypothetical protein
MLPLGIYLMLSVVYIKIIAQAYIDARDKEYIDDRHEHRHKTVLGMPKEV